MRTAERDADTSPDVLGGVRLPVPRPRFVEAGIAAGFVLLALVWTFPLALHLTTKVVDPGDPVFSSWVISWGGHGVLHHPLRIFDGNIFWPEPLTLAFADHMLGLQPLALPLWVLSRNALFTQNATVILLLALNGWCTYLLVRQLTGRRWPAVAAGVGFALSPFAAAHLSQANILQTYPFALAWLFSVRVVRRCRPRDAVGLAAAWVLAMGASWYYLVFAGLEIAAVVGVELWRTRRRIPWADLVPLLFATGCAVLACSALLAIPYARVVAKYPDAVRPLAEAAVYTPGPSSLVVAPANNRVWAELTASQRPRDYNEKMFFFGVVPTVLAVGGVVDGIRRRRYTNVVAPLLLVLIAVLFALGPYQEWGGRRHQMPFYYVHTYVSSMRFMRSLARSGVLAYLAIAVLGGRFLSRVRARPDRAIVCAAVCVLLVAEGATRVTLLQAPTASPAYRWLRTAEQPGAVLDLPTGFAVDGRLAPPTVFYEARAMALSTAHFRPITNGVSGYTPPVYLELVRAVASFPDETALALLRARGVAYVLVTPALLRGTPWRWLRTQVGLAQLDRHPGLQRAFADEQTIVYRVRGTLAPEEVRR